MHEHSFVEQCFVQVVLSILWIRVIFAHFYDYLFKAWVLYSKSYFNSHAAIDAGDLAAAIYSVSYMGFHHLHRSFFTNINDQMGESFQTWRNLWTRYYFLCMNWINTYAISVLFLELREIFVLMHVIYTGDSRFYPKYIPPWYYFWRGETCLLYQ